MKPITYWEAKREQVCQFITAMTRMGLQSRQVPAPPSRKSLRAKWYKARHKWERRQREILAYRRRLEKAHARLAYFESRIRMLTPTFWERL